MARKNKKKKLEWSKIMTLLVILSGFIISQESLFLMFLCIKNDYTSTAAWLTAAVGLAEAVIAAGLTGYLGLARAQNTANGLTYEKAKAKGFSDFVNESDMPSI